MTVERCGVEGRIMFSAVVGGESWYFRWDHVSSSSCLWSDVVLKVESRYQQLFVERCSTEGRITLSAVICGAM